MATVLKVIDYLCLRTIRTVHVLPLWVALPVLVAAGIGYLAVRMKANERKESPKESKQC